MIGKTIGHYQMARIEWPSMQFRPADGILKFIHFAAKRQPEFRPAFQGRYLCAKEIRVAADREKKRRN